MANDNYTNLDKNSKLQLNSVIKASLEADGVDVDQISMLSATGLLVQGFNTLFDDVSLAVKNIARESNLLSCRNNSSLYNQLVQATTEISLSKPSKLKMYVEIPLESIRLLGKKVQDNTYEFEYTNDNIIMLDELEFIPVIPVHYLRYTKTQEKDEVRAFYKNNSGDIINIPTQRDRFQDIATVAIIVEFQQVTKVTKEEVFSDAQLDKFVFTTDAPIHDFELEYRDNQGADWIPIGKRLFYTRGVSNYIEYKILSNNSISLEHKYVSGGFKPEVGGILRITAYTTTGQDINTKEAAQVVKAYPNQLLCNYYPYTDSFQSSGGRLASNDKEYLRNYIIKLKGSRRRVDTESDMGIFLLNYEGSSVFKPKLTVNDVKSRIFNIYTVLSFNHKLGDVDRRFTIPTDSATVNIDLKQLPTKMVQGLNWYCFASDMGIKSTQDSETFSYVYDKSIDTSIPNQGDNEVNYFYVSPFIYSYSPTDNFCRSFMDAQYDEPYPTVVTFDGDDSLISTRFVNTNLRMNDYTDSTGKRQMFITAQIRADESTFVRTSETMDAKLEIEDIDGNKFEIPLSEVTDEGHDNIYNLKFNFKSDRRIFNRWCDITYTDGDSGEVTKTINVTRPIGLKLYTIAYDEVLKDNRAVHVVTFEASVDIFKEITPQLWLQTNMNYSGTMDFVLMPLVSMDFYQKYKNQEKIIEEILSVFDFIQQEVYGELDEFSSVGFGIRDMQETLFRVSIKFAKTYGRSKFLNVGNYRTDHIKNLQLKPTIYIRKIDDEFDESSIASDLNTRLITHDYEMTDLHMSVLVKDVLTDASDSVSILQFVNFDNYPSDYHLVKRNELEYGNDDVPEVVSIEPVYDEKLGIYNYNINMKTL